MSFSHIIMETIWKEVVWKKNGSAARMAVDGTYNPNLWRLIRRISNFLLRRNILSLCNHHFTINNIRLYVKLEHSVLFSWLYSYKIAKSRKTAMIWRKISFYIYLQYNDSNSYNGYLSSLQKENVFLVVVITFTYKINILFQLQNHIDRHFFNYLYFKFPVET